MAVEQSPASLVLTLEMDGEAFAELDALRRRYYPPQRNLVPAHVTLFYRLPEDRRREIRALLAQVAAGEKPFDIGGVGVKAIERGVAILLHSPRLNQLRAGLAEEWWPWLTEPDRAGFQPHVTIQINVSEGEAHRTQKAVAAELRLSRIRALGLHIWRYRDGRWEDERLFRFRR
ncbi:MAG: 2'-5' RNA ligase family protein [Propylenella sp.]